SSRSLMEDVTPMAFGMSSPVALREDRMRAESHTVSDTAIRELTNVFKLLSDETRFRILIYLAENQELHVTDLCERLGQSQPAVSHHLALLRVSGLIESRREGKHNYYSVRTDVFGELLVSLLSSANEMPRKLKFHDFTLTYSGK